MKPYDHNLVADSKARYDAAMKDFEKKEAEYDSVSKEITRTAIILMMLNICVFIFIPLLIGGVSGVSEEYLGLFWKGILWVISGCIFAHVVWLMFYPTSPPKPITKEEYEEYRKKEADGYCPVLLTRTSYVNELGLSPYVRTRMQELEQKGYDLGEARLIAEEEERTKTK